MGGRMVTIERAEKILSQLVTPGQMAVYGPVLNAAAGSGLRFALGGGLATSAYSAYLRNTKDMDLYVVKPDQERLIEIMQEHGFSEYTEVAYDPTWSYRGAKGEYILDLLWKMLNGRKAVDEVWTSKGWNLRVQGITIRLVPPEELLWSKLYILRRERTDWPDILNIIYAQGPAMEWDRLLADLEDDTEVLASVLSLFRWMCPGRAAELPQSMWEKLGLEQCCATSPLVSRKRTALFKGNDWFARELSQ